MYGMCRLSRPSRAGPGGLQAAVCICRDSAAMPSFSVCTIGNAPELPPLGQGRPRVAEGGLWLAAWL